MDQKTREEIGYWEVVAIGIGGMVGGGIFAVLGLAVQLAHGGTPLAFAIAGLVALITAYAYTRLSVTFPSQGGTVTFLDRAFGSGLVTGSLNVLLWLSYVVMLSLYAFAFGSYGATFLPAAWQGVGKHILISLSILAITGLNMFSAKAIGEAENWIVGLKVAILPLQQCCKLPQSGLESKGAGITLNTTLTSSLPISTRLTNVRINSRLVSQSASTRPSLTFSANSSKRVMTNCN
jgi:amino acid transporter